MLDCQSRASTLASVSRIYQVGESTIESFLIDFDLEEHYELCDPSRPGDEELRYVLERELKCRALQLDRVFWFHLTRARKGEKFAEGLLPLSESLNSVWEVVLSVFRGTVHEHRLSELRKTGVPGMHYHLKVGDPLHAGPFAMLVRDVASKANEIGNHDYLWLPEIMEDICNGYEERYGESLSYQLSAELSPTVVKFWSTKRLGSGCVDAALYYLYLTARRQRLTMYANTCFDGEDSAIPREQIVDIEQSAI